jgi:putative membrane-bound dehydrogenase-like protein
MRTRLPKGFIFTLIFALAAGIAAAGEKPPHAQKSMPGPALTPEEAMAKMQLPPGFKVECVASEPLIVNPTAMTFDERGRIWICESVEYPRATAGKGTDRIKILEDTDGDGKFDKATIFKDGLNIPCGVVMGNGGVYATNSPDILFLQDTDGDGVCDKEEVIFTGFGRADRHELPNSLIWGPDGWLYGMNGVFNGSRVEYNKKTFDFTCAIWRYHPKWKKFELFSEGTSNPWGLDYDLNGEWFLSCCVIDHLFHMTQSGYYNRQGGPYPAFTHKLNSITTQKHQMAAYAGLCIYQGDAFPEEYRGTLFMGNLHGSAINRDIVTKNGATFTQKNAPDDFLQANDAWFMPVAQKVGPDGCLYIMDWYDRYHCYQDAMRDAPGLDRTHGRIYRISYKDTPRAKPFDLKKLSNDELLKLLGHPNNWQRREAQRLLNERWEPSLIPTLQRMALDSADQTQAHMHALWLLCSQKEMDPEFHLKLLSQSEPARRNWGVRACGQIESLSPAIIERLKALAKDTAPDVRCQVAVTAGRIEEAQGLSLLFAMLSNDENAKDPLIPTIIYNNLKPMATSRMESILTFIEANAAVEVNFGQNVVPWIRDRLNADRSKNPSLIVNDVKKSLAIGDETKLNVVLRSTIDAFANANIKIDDRIRPIDEVTRGGIAKLAAGTGPAKINATIVAMWWNDPGATASARGIVADSKAQLPVRTDLLRALAERKDAGSLEAFCAVVADNSAPLGIRKESLEAISALNDAKAAAILLSNFNTLPGELKAQCINALVQSTASANALVDALEKKQIPTSAVNSNHVRQIQAMNDENLSKRLVSAWGTVKTDRDPERVEVIKKMREVVGKGHGDPMAGWKVFETKCQQCHSIYGKGSDVGPELTGAGRETLDAILTNVLDPNLIIGDGYYTQVAKLKSGKVVTGLLAEKSDTKIVLKREGGVLDTIPVEDLEKITPQKISLMPEGLEKNMNEQEFCDLVEFLLTKAPPTAKASGQQSTADIAKDVEAFAPGWKIANCGRDMNPGLQFQYGGKKNVLLTHPLNANTPCSLSKAVGIPEGKKTTLHLVVGHYPDGDFDLVVKADGKELFKKLVGAKTAKDGWMEADIDLTPYAGKSPKIELLNQPNNWAWEAAYWAEITIKSE